MARPSWDIYFTQIAKAVAGRADCRRRQIGSVIVDEHNRVVSTGYNGTPPGSPLSCLGGDCPRAFQDVEHNSGGYETCIDLHSEQNCVANARQDLKGCRIYISDIYGNALDPCPMCEKLVLACGMTWYTG